MSIPARTPHAARKKSSASVIRFFRNTERFSTIPPSMMKTASSAQMPIRSYFASGRSEIILLSIDVFCPFLQKRRAFHVAGNAAFIGRLEFRAGAVNHDEVLRTLGAQRVGDARRDHHRRVVRPAKVVSLDDDTHRAPLHPGAFIDKDYFHIPLDEKHDVPLLLVVGAQRIISRLVDEKALEPRLRLRPLRNERRMDVKALRGIGKHACRGPLAGPEADLR